MRSGEIGLRKLAAGMRPWLLAVAALFLTVLCPKTSFPSQAQDSELDREFREPQYLVHISETGTMYGPQKKDIYILYPVAPDENGVLLTADGYGGWFINKAELAGGPFTTPRQVCAQVKSIPREKLSSDILAFRCEQLTATCQDLCRSTEHMTWDGVSEHPPCTCICEMGYEFQGDPDTGICFHCSQICPERNNDLHMVWDEANSAPNQCACRCEEGYNNLNSTLCEESEAPPRFRCHLQPLHHPGPRPRPSGRRV